MATTYKFVRKDKETPALFVEQDTVLRGIEDLINLLDMTQVVPASTWDVLTVTYPTEPVVVEVRFLKSGEGEETRVIARFEMSIATDEEVVVGEEVEQ